VETTCAAGRATWPGSMNSRGLPLPYLQIMGLISKPKMEYGIGKYISLEHFMKNVVFFGIKGEFRDLFRTQKWVMVWNVYTSPLNN